MKKDNLSKEAAKLDKKLKELAKTTTRKFTQVQSGGDYQFHGNSSKPKVPETKKQKWIFIPYPVDFTQPKKIVMKPSLDFFSNFVTFQKAFHEWLGLFSYYFMGRTERIF